MRATIGATPAFTSDIGPGGFSAELLRVPPPGTPVDGTIRVGEQDVAYRGEVAWAKAGNPHMSLRGRVGVRFTAIPDWVREALAVLAADRG